MHDLIIIGAGPGGIALAAEAFASGIDPSQIVILEKGPTHNSAIRQLYPEKKLTTANYKGFAARCEGLLCVGETQSKLWPDHQTCQSLFASPIVGTLALDTFDRDYS